MQKMEQELMADFDEIELQHTVKELNEILRRKQYFY